MVVFAALGQVKQALAAGILSVDDATQTLIGMGWPAGFASGWASMQSDSARVALVKQATGRIRAAYLAGEVAEDYVAAALNGLGIIPSASQSLQTIWRIERTPNRRRRSAGQIVADLAGGLLTQVEAYTRLRNLGYPDQDIVSFLHEARDRSDKAAVGGPISRLKAWATADIIGEAEFRSDAQALQYPPHAIENYWKEVLLAREKAAKKSAPKPKAPKGAANGQTKGPAGP